MTGGGIYGEFLEACKQDDYEKVEGILLEGLVRLRSKKDNIDVLEAVVRNKCLRTLRIVLKDRRINPAIKDNFALREAATSGYSSIVRELMLFPEVEVCGEKAGSPNALHLAIVENQVACVQLLIVGNRIDANDAIETAIKQGNVKILTILLENQKIASIISQNRYLDLAKSLNQEKVVEFLQNIRKPLDFPRKEELLIEAVKTQQNEMAIEMIESDQDLDLGYGSSEALRCTQDVQIAKLLLQNEKVDPKACFSEALRNAVKSGNVELVKLLLQDGRVDPAAVDNEPLIEACGLKDPEIVKELLKFGSGVDPTARNNLALKKAAMNKNVEIVKCLLDDGRTLVNVKRAHLFEAAASEEVKAIKELLKNYKPDSSVDEMAPFRKIIDGKPTSIKEKVAQNPHLAVRLLYYCSSRGKKRFLVEILEAAGKDVILPEHCNVALYMTIVEGYHNILQVFLDDGRVQLNENSGFLTHTALALSTRAASKAKGHTVSFPTRKLISTFQAAGADFEVNNNAILKSACAAGSYTLVEELLSSQRGLKIDPTFDDNLLIRLACYYGHQDIVELLLENRKVEETIDKDQCGRIAARRGHSEISKLFNLMLMKKLQFKDICNNVQDIFDAIRDHDGQRFHQLLEAGNAHLGLSNNKLFKEAIYKGWIEAVETLLDHRFLGSVDPSADDDWALRFCVGKEDVPLVEMLLLDRRVDPAVNDNEMIKTAAKKGYRTILRMLLMIPSVDPTVNGNSIIKTCFEQGDVGAILSLLQDGRADPSFDDSVLFHMAMDYDFARILDRLLQDPRMDLNVALYKAAFHGRVDLIEDLLKKSSVDPASRDSECLRIAAAKGFPSLVSLLLEDGRAVPPPELLRWATIKGDKQMVCHLLADSRVNPADNDCLALVTAIERDELGIFQVLVTDPRVDVNEPFSLPILAAVQNKRQKMIKTLVCDYRFDASRIPPDAKKVAVQVYDECVNGTISQAKVAINLASFLMEKLDKKHNIVSRIVGMALGSKIIVTNGPRKKMYIRSRKLLNSLIHLRFETKDKDETEEQMLIDDPSEQDEYNCFAGSLKRKNNSNNRSPKRNRRRRRKSGP